MKTLIVEDSALKITYVKEALRSFRINDYLIAKSVREAIKLALKNDFQLLVCDLGLPLFPNGVVKNCKEGLTLVQELDYIRRVIPIIIFSTAELNSKDKLMFTDWKYPLIGQARSYDELKGFLRNFVECKDTNLSR